MASVKEKKNSNVSQYKILVKKVYIKHVKKTKKEIKKVNIGNRENSHLTYVIWFHFQFSLTKRKRNVHQSWNNMEKGT